MSPMTYELINSKPVNCANYPDIDRRYPLKQIPKVHRLAKVGHIRAKMFSALPTLVSNSRRVAGS